MNTKALVLALCQIGSGLLLGVIILYGFFKVIRALARKRYGIEGFNTSFGLVTAAILFSAGYIMSSIISPVIATFRMLMRRNPGIGSLLGKGALYTLIYFALATVFSFLVVVISYLLFTGFTRKINEAEEIKNNNLAIGMILGVVIIVISLLVKEGFVMLTEAIVPFPELPKSIGF